MQNKTEFGSFIKKRRTEKNYSQNQLADMLYVTKSAVSKWERGVSYPDISMISDICRVLDISEHELITASEDTESRIEKRQARRYRVIDKVYFFLPVTLYALALLVCFICNLAIQGTLSWFFVVLASVACAFTFIPGVFRFFDKLKLLVFAISTFAGIVLVLAASALYTHSAYWLLTTVIAVLIFYLIVFAPPIMSEYPIFTPVKKYKYIILCAAVTLLLVLLIASVEIMQKFNFLNAVIIALYAMLPFYYCATICLFRLNRAIKTGSCIIIFTLFLYFSSAVIKSLMNLGGIMKDYKIDFTDWTNCISGNTAIIAVTALMAAGIIVLLYGIIIAVKNRKNKTQRQHGA